MLSRGGRLRCRFVPTSVALCIAVLVSGEDVPPSRLPQSAPQGADGLHQAEETKTQQPPASRQKDAADQSPSPQPEEPRHVASPPEQVAEGEQSIGSATAEEQGTSPPEAKDPAKQSSSSATVEEQGALPAQQESEPQESSGRAPREELVASPPEQIAKAEQSSGSVTVEDKGTSPLEQAQGADQSSGSATVEEQAAPPPEPESQQSSASATLEEQAASPPEHAAKLQQSSDSVTVEEHGASPPEQAKEAEQSSFGATVKKQDASHPERTPEARQSSGSATVEEQVARPPEQVAEVEQSRDSTTVEQHSAASPQKVSEAKQNGAGAPVEQVVASSEHSKCEAGSSVDLDHFAEALQLRLVPFVSAQSPQSAHAHFEFSVQSSLSPAFRADVFDLFPKSIGKLLNAHRALAGFEATLTRGRWKEEWGPAPREFRPPGAVLVQATDAKIASDPDETWRFLISALSGSLCASFEGMDPAHPASPWVRPIDVPWAEPGQQLRMASLPYEPVCTENLTPWLKLLPCGKRRGLAALLAPLSVAESPLTSLSLAAAVGAGKVELRASLDVILPVNAQENGFVAWLGRGSFVPCPAAARSTVSLWSKKEPQSTGTLDPGSFEIVRDGASVLLVFDSTTFAGLKRSALGPVSEIQELPAPWADIRIGGTSQHAGDGVSVMRDILSKEGFSERTHGRYLLRFTNDGSARRVRFMDHLPFFVRPLWHTFRATFQQPGSVSEEFHGWEAMRRLAVQFGATDNIRKPTELFLEVALPAGATVSVFIDVLKSFIQLREFSSACEKGFDVGSAAWLELDDASLTAGNSSGVVGSFLASLESSSVQGGAAALASASLAAPGAWRLRMTQGYIVLLPMPDFSMPFNVIALSSTALTFFFGSVFRLTAAGRVPHWCLKKEGEPPPSKRFQKIVFVLTLAAFFGLHYVERAHRNVPILRKNAAHTNTCPTRGMLIQGRRGRELSVHTWPIEALPRKNNNVWKATDSTDVIIFWLFSARPARRIAHLKRSCYASKVCYASTANRHKRRLTLRLECTYGDWTFSPLP